MADARFQDGGEGPLRLVAQEAADVPVMSALVQDAVLTVGDLRHDRRRRRFAALVSRFRWEDREEAARAGRPFERVRSLLVVEDVVSVQVQGLTPADRDLVLSVLALDWHPGPDGTGRLVLTLSGDGAFALTVEALDIRLDDVARPHLARSRSVPGHD